MEMFGRSNANVLVNKWHKQHVGGINLKGERNGILQKKTICNNNKDYWFMISPCRIRPLSYWQGRSETRIKIQFHDFNNL